MCVCCFLPISVIIIKYWMNGAPLRFARMRNKSRFDQKSVNQRNKKMENSQFVRFQLNISIWNCSFLLGIRHLPRSLGSIRFPAASSGSSSFMIYSISVQSRQAHAAYADSFVIFTIWCVLCACWQNGHSPFVLAHNVNVYVYMLFV